MNLGGFYSESDEDSISGTIPAPTIIKKRVLDPNKNQKSKYKGGAAHEYPIQRAVCLMIL